MTPERFAVAGPDGRLTGWTWGLGGDRLPVLLLHGVNGMADEWLRVAGALSPRRRVVAFDLRGHGGSDPGAGYTADRYAADACAVLDACDVAEAHVCGHSFGGVAALALTAASPGRVRTVATLGTARGGDAEAVRRIEAGVRRLGVRGFLHAALREYAYGPDADAAQVADVVERASRHDAETLLAILGEAFGADALAVAAGVHRPALVATGEHDRTCPPSAVHPLAAALAVAVTVLSGRGHLPHLERPAEVADLLENHASAYERTRRRHDDARPASR